MQYKDEEDEWDECLTCSGLGVVESYDDDDDETYTIVHCPACHGKGFSVPLDDRDI